MAEPTVAGVLGKAVDATVAGVEQLAAAVEKVAPDAWAVLVRQQVLEGWIGLGHTVLVIGVVIFLIRAVGWMHSRIKDWDTPGPGDTARIVSFIVLCIALVVAFIFSAVDLWYIQEYIGQILNPRYYAAQEILEAIKG